MISEERLLQGVHSRQLLVQTFAQECLILDARGVLFLPRFDTLVVSDLHLEKGSYLASWGNPVSALDSRATLLKLQAIMLDYKPYNLICLGDSFHDLNSVKRMQDNDFTFLCELISSVERWTWVVGNHDSEIDATLAGEVVESVQLANITLLHEPVTNVETQIIGHFHPKASHKVRRTALRGKCFALHDKLLIMPAFGQYTGGLDINDDALLALLPKKSRRCMIMYDDAIYNLGSA